MERLLRLLAEDEPAHAEDEEVRIIKDAETGELKQVVVKKPQWLIKRQKRLAQESPVKYPERVDITFTEMSTFEIEHDGRNASVSIHYRDPEGWYDILRSKTSEGDFLVHSLLIFNHVVSQRYPLPTRIGTFLREGAGPFFECARKNPSLGVQHMNDSRTYYDLHIDDRSISVRGKYLDMTFRLLMCDGELIVVTEHLRDADAEEIPLFALSLPKEIFFKTSAYYDEDEEGWVTA